MVDQFRVPSPDEVFSRPQPPPPEPDQTLDRRYRYLAYRFRKRFWSLWGARVDVTNELREPVFYLYQKAFRLREDFRVFGDSRHTEELLHIQARQIIDFSAAYDVYDKREGRLAGTLRRRGWKSLAQDEWELLSPQQELVGLIREDNLALALLRRFALGSLLPASFHFEDLQGRVVATVRTRFNLLFTVMDLEIPRETPGLGFDPRMFIAAVSLLVLIEGKQDSYGIPG